MTDDKTIRLRPLDAQRYTKLRLRMLESDPWAFGASPDDDRGLDVEHLGNMLADDDYVIVGVEDRSGELVAAAGIMRSKRPKHAHRASIWGVFVDGKARGQGLGRAVMTRAVEVARSWQGVDFVDLGVSENSPAAKGLYESLGFEQWGREPEATQVDGQRYDEIYMTLRLRATD